MTQNDIALFKAPGVKTVISTTPRYEDRSFGTNDELNALIDELELKPSVTGF
jgi:hypothetical protein